MLIEWEGSKERFTMRELLKSLMTRATKINFYFQYQADPPGRTVKSRISRSRTPRSASFMSCLREERGKLIKSRRVQVRGDPHNLWRFYYSKRDQNLIINFFLIISGVVLPMFEQLKDKQRKKNFRIKADRERRHEKFFSQQLRRIKCRSEI